MSGVQGWCNLTCFWVSHDLVDCKTLQPRPGVFHLVVEGQGDGELQDPVVCSPHPAT